MAPPRDITPFSPAGFQRAEFLQEHGMIDMIVPRRDMHATLGKVLDFFAE